MNKTKLVYKNPGDLIPYIHNAKIHHPKQIDQIAASIKEFGFTNAILLDGENGVIAGHGRLEAAKKLGLESVPCIELGYLTKAQRKALVLADNRLAEVDTEWDMDLVRIELESLKELDFDIDLTGFELEDIEILDELPSLPDGEKEPFQQMTFTLHDEQHAIVSDAITKARTNPLSDKGINDNSNGNALTLICEEYLNGVG